MKKLKTYLFAFALIAAFATNADAVPIYQSDDWFGASIFIDYGCVQIEECPGIAGFC